MRRIAGSLLLGVLVCAPILAGGNAGGRSLQREIDGFFGSPAPLTLELREEQILQPGVAVVFFDFGERHLQMEIALPDDLITQLPFQVVIDRTSFAYFVGRQSFGGELDVVDRKALGRHLSNAGTALLCGNRAVMSQGDLFVPDRGRWVHTTFGFGTTSALEVEAAKVGVFSKTCGLSVSSCPTGTSCFWGQGSCGVGEDPLGGRWCCCFI